MPAPCSTPTARSGQSAPARTATDTRVAAVTGVPKSENRMVAPIVAAAAISAPHKYTVSIWVTPFCLWLGHKTSPNACNVFAEPTETVTPTPIAAAWDGERASEGEGCSVASPGTNGFGFGAPSTTGYTQWNTRAAGGCC